MFNAYFTDYQTRLKREIKEVSYWSAHKYITTAPTAELLKQLAAEKTGREFFTLKTDGRLIVTTHPFLIYGEHIVHLIATDTQEVIFTDYKNSAYTNQIHQNYFTEALLTETK